ncbi:MAG: sulfotransferase [Dokdonella sp.]|nr:sulfotransferase [Dokdonella sp.]
MQELIDRILAAMKSGQHAQALTLSRELVHSFPHDEGALSLLAVSEQNAGDLETAKNLLLGLTRNHPGTWQHWNNLGNIQRLLGDLDGAGEAYQRALALHQESPRLRANLGLLHLNQGKYALARDELCAAIVMKGAEDAMRIWAAVSCQACGDDETARLIVRDWPQWTGVSEEAMLELGWLLAQLGDLEAAESILAREFQDSTIRIRALARRIFALERLNRVEDAATLAQQLGDPARIADKQSRMEALHALAKISSRAKDFAGSRQYYEAALAFEVPPRYRQSLYLGLARVCDQMGDEEATMAALEQAHADELARHTAEDLERVAGTGLIALLDPRFEESGPVLDEADGAPTELESPVFVVGFPRSGTTLLEQMLSAHPAFASADEQPMVQRVIEKVREWNVAYPAGLARLTAAQCDQLRDLYRAEASRTVALPAGVRLVDKHPLNFLALPMIRRIFPNAPVIFCVRHACDSILSSYMQNFRDPRLAAECASPARLADLYVRLTRRWKHDSERRPERILISRHEELVADPETQLRRIGDLLGVEEIAPMLKFSEHAQARGFIGTPSYAQVVQGLNAEAVGRWQRYRAYLEPALPTLAPVLDYWGYSA